MDASEFKNDRRPSSSKELGRFSRRLKEVIGASSVRGFASKCGLSDAVLRSYLRGLTFPTLDRLNVIAEAAGVRPGWLVTGEGPMRLDERGHGAGVERPENYASREELEKSCEFVMVPRYDVQASAGGGALVHSEQVVDHLAFKRKWVAAMGLQPDKLALISARGDSMEPTISDGDLLLVDIRETTSRADGIYVLRMDTDLVAKRIQPGLDGTIYVRSDNSAYPEIKAEKHQVKFLDFIGKVVWVGSKI